MEYRELIDKRCSTRRLGAEPPTRQTIERILEAVRTAPTAGNLQAYRIVVVCDPKVRAALAEAAYHQSVVAEAPVCLVFLADGERSSKRYGQRGAELYAVQDATIAATLAWLAAVDEGLASVWIGAFNEDAVSSAIRKTGKLRPVAMLPLGLAEESPGATERRPLEELVEWVE